MNRQRSWPVLAAFFLATAFLPHQVQAAGDPPTEQKLLADDGVTGRGFGYSVSISGDTAVIGSPGNSFITPEDYSGWAYIFVRAGDGTWKQQASLTAVDGVGLDRFGTSVSISGDMAVIGAPEDDDKGDDSGSAYIFVRATDGTWKQETRLTAPDGAAEDQFGDSVAISGDTAVIGAFRYDGKGDYSSSAYIFIRAADGTWKQQAKLTAADGSAEDAFGWSVAISGDTAVIGAFRDNDKGDYSTSAYIFVRAGDGTWKQQAKLAAADGADGDAFGTSVSISGDTAVIGTPGDNDKGDYSGSAYIFVRAADGTWKQQAKLNAADGADHDWFGRRVAVSGDIAVIGAIWDDDKGEGSGSAYIFVRAADGTWKQQAKLTPADGAKGDYFGSSVAVSGDTTVIGAYNNAGSAYSYSLPSK